MGGQWPQDTTMGRRVAPARQLRPFRRLVRGVETVTRPYGGCRLMNERAPGLLLVIGGAIMALLWPLFTSLHGPTSYNEDRHFLGRDPLFWGAMTEGVPSLLIAAGLMLLSPFLWDGAGRAARIGYVLLLVSLVIPGVLDLAILATVPPLLYPLEAAGLMLLAWASRVLRGWARVVLTVMGALLLSTMWSVFVPRETWDAVNGYRIDGFVANVLVGLGWAAVGASLLPRATVSSNTTTEVSA